MALFRAEYLTRSQTVLRSGQDSIFIYLRYEIYLELILWMEFVAYKQLSFF